MPSVQKGQKGSVLPIVIVSLAVIILVVALLMALVMVFGALKKYADKACHSSITNAGAYLSGEQGLIDKICKATGLGSGTPSGTCAGTEVDMDALKSQLMSSEGVRLFPYRDSVRSTAHPIGVCTIGYGHSLETGNAANFTSVTNKTIQEFVSKCCPTNKECSGAPKITEAEAKAVFEKDIQSHIPKGAVSNWDSLPSMAKQISIEMAYQMGVGGFSDRSRNGGFLTALENEDFPEAADQIIAVLGSTSGSRANDQAERMRNVIPVADCVNSCGIATATSTEAGLAILSEAQKRLTSNNGTAEKYRYCGREGMPVKGIGKTTTGVDCVGLLYVSMRSAGLIDDSAKTFSDFSNGWTIYQPKYGQPVGGKNHEIKINELDTLAPGDLLFFAATTTLVPKSTGSVPNIGHAGIYVGKESDTCHQYIQANGRLNEGDKCGACRGDICKVTVNCLEDRMKGSAGTKRYVYAARPTGTATITPDTTSCETSTIPSSGSNNTCALEKNVDDIVDSTTGGKIHQAAIVNIPLTKINSTLVNVDSPPQYIYTPIAEALEKASEKCTKCFKVVSAYRTCAVQTTLYNRYLAGGTVAAKPGESNHNGGQGVDINGATAGSGYECNNNPSRCSKKLVDLLQSVGLKHYHGCNTLDASGKYYTGSDCVHFSPTGN